MKLCILQTKCKFSVNIQAGYIEISTVATVYLPYAYGLFRWQAGQSRS